ncbi:MAG: hypothetical protein HY999_00160 [Nitrospinae bacterium]|nr:hypothetical protein [Nitrospinota bacterium]
MRNYLNPSANFQYIKRIAVLPFNNLTDEKFAGERVRSIVIIELLSRGIFDIVEMGEIATTLKGVYEEWGYREGELVPVDKEIAKRLGERLDVQAIILGSVEEYGISRSGTGSTPIISLSLRMIDTNSGEILWQASCNKRGGSYIGRLFGLDEMTMSNLTMEVAKKIIDTLL